MASSHRSECSRIFQSAYLKSLILCGPYYSMVKMSIGLTVVVYVVALKRDLEPRTVFVIIGLYNILRLHVGWQMPYALQQLSEVVVSLRRIQVTGVRR